MSATQSYQTLSGLTDKHIKNLAQPLVGIIKEFYENPYNKEKFEKWKQEKDAK